MRRTFGPVLLLGLAAGTLAAVAGSKPWVEPSSADGQTQAFARFVAVGGDSGELPVATSLALVALACWGVVLVTRARVRRAVAVLGLLEHCQAGGAELASSDALFYEAGRNPYPIRQAHAEAILSTARVRQPLTPTVEARADVLVAAGLRPLDALHLGSAEAIGATYFCTCDDQLLRRGRTLAVPPLAMWRTTR